MRPAPGPDGTALHTTQNTQGSRIASPTRMSRGAGHPWSRRSSRNSEAAAARSFLGDFRQSRWAFWARDVEIQRVAWRHSEMLLGGNVLLSCGNARMPERHGELFDRRAAF